MGARLSCREERLPPLEIEAAPLQGIEYELPIASAQVKSCLLFAGLLAEGETWVREPARSRDHTERMLAAAGAEVAWLRGGISVRPAKRLEPGELAVPADFSSAAFFIVAALLVPGSEVTLEGVGTNPTRTGLLAILERMGAEIEVEPVGERGGEPIGTIRARASALRAPRSAARRSRWRSTSCRCSPSPPASPRARRRSATRPSCAARSPTGSPPPARR